MTSALVPEMAIPAAVKAGQRADLRSVSMPWSTWRDHIEEPASPLALSFGNHKEAEHAQGLQQQKQTGIIRQRVMREWQVRGIRDIKSVFEHLFSAPGNTTQNALLHPKHFQQLIRNDHEY
jgi:hypothetical protein